MTEIHSQREFKHHGSSTENLQIKHGQVLPREIEHQESSTQQRFSLQAIHFFLHLREVL